LRTICGGNEKDCTSKNKIIALKAGKASWQKVEKRHGKPKAKDKDTKSSHAEMREKNL